MSKRKRRSFRKKTPIFASNGQEFDPSDRIAPYLPTVGELMRTKRVDLIDLMITLCHTIRLVEEERNAAQIGLEKRHEALVQSKKQLERVNMTAIARSRAVLDVAIYPRTFPKSDRFTKP